MKWKVTTMQITFRWHSVLGLSRVVHCEGVRRRCHFFICVDKNRNWAQTKLMDVQVVFFLVKIKNYISWSLLVLLKVTMNFKRHFKRLNQIKKYNKKNFISKSWKNIKDKKKLLKVGFLAGKFATPYEEERFKNI